MLHSWRYMCVECNGSHRPKKLLCTAYWSFRSPANEQHRKGTTPLNWPSCGYHHGQWSACAWYINICTHKYVDHSNKYIGMSGYCISFVKRALRKRASWMRGSPFSILFWRQPWEDKRGNGFFGKMAHLFFECAAFKSAAICLLPVL